MQVICFEDQFVSRLSPIVHARPAYAVTCASFRLVDWLRQIDGTLSAAVRDYLNMSQTLDFELSPPSRSAAEDAGGVLLVNARLTPTRSTFETLQALASSDRSLVIRDAADDVVLASRIVAADLVAGSDTANAADANSTGSVIVDQLLSRCETLTEAPQQLSAFTWPHDVVSTHMSAMADSMQWRIEHGDYQQLQDGVFVREGVSIGDYASIHVNDGPILLEKDVKVGPFCFLEGPLHAGAGTRVIEHAAIKDGVSLGHTVKIGGEVEASVIEPYTNKQHHGFLGHSYLGSWINLGAGTCNSDLKNTYGKINIQYGDKKQASGMQFLGCIMGDYSKSAINTGIFTGKVVGVCSMLYGFVTSNVPSYVNYARLFGQTSLLPAEVMINTQARMFARRNVQQRECDKQLIRDMYRLTEGEREAAEQLML